MFIDPTIKNSEAFPQLAPENQQLDNKPTDKLNKSKIQEKIFTSNPHASSPSLAERVTISDEPIKIDLLLLSNDQEKLPVDSSSIGHTEVVESVDDDQKEWDSFEKKESVLYDLHSFSPSSGGILVTYQLKPEFNTFGNSYASAREGFIKMDAANAEIFPAVEMPYGATIAILDRDSNNENLVNFQASYEFYENEKLSPTGVPEKLSDKEMVEFEENRLDRLTAMKDKYLMDYAHMRKATPFLNELGYRSYTIKQKDGHTELFVEFPDKMVLDNRLKVLREKFPSFPEIKIVSSEGIASDEDFIKAFLKYDLLLSDGEFCHDQCGHALNLFNRLIKEHILKQPIGSTYKNSQSQWRKSISLDYNAVKFAEKELLSHSLTPDEVKTRQKEIEILMTLVGIKTDLAWSHQLEEKNFSYTNYVAKDPRWVAFLEKTYPGEISEEKLDKLIKLLDEYQDKYINQSTS